MKYTAAHGEVVTPVETGTWKLSDDSRHLSFTLNFPRMIERNGGQIGKCTVLLYTEKYLTALDKEFYRVRSVTNEAKSKSRPKPSSLSLESGAFPEIDWNGLATALSNFYFGNAISSPSLLFKFMILFDWYSTSITYIDYTMKS